MFWEIYVSLCQQKGESPNAVAKKLSITSGTVSGWKLGNRQPQNSTLKKIAGYFNVSIGYLLGKESQPNPIIQDELYQLIEQLDLEDRAELKGTVKQMLKAEKYKEKDSVSNVG